MSDRPLLGIGYANVALVFYATQDTLVRHLARGYPVFEVSFMRSLVIVITTGATIVLLGQGGLFVPRRRVLLAVRGLASLAGVTCYYYGLRHLQLAEANTIFMSGPIFVALMVGPVLGEVVTGRRWLAIGVGFLGLVIVMRPGGGLDPVWSGVVLMAAAIYAGSMMVNRLLTRSEQTLTIVFGVNAVVVLTVGPFLPLFWVTPPLLDGLMLLATGAVATCAQLLLVQAYRHAAASTIAPYDYMSVAYVAILGFLVFGEVPSWNLVAGAVVLVASGLLILREETRRRA